MSDFIYSRKMVTRGHLTKEIQRIFHHDQSDVREFHGNWGTLAVSHNPYNGFQPYETAQHIVVVIGGPVLCFRDNRFLTENNDVAGTHAIYDAWLTGKIQWDEDLSGPFAILIINKGTHEVMCISDLMSFIPVYMYHSSADFMLSTHVDALARAAGQQSNPDPVSWVDFILHGVVTYPYTCYANLRQLAPATVHTSTGNGSALRYYDYWLPEEKYIHESINDAAVDLRTGLQSFINAVTEGMSHVAHFISGGEDSRAISGLLPKRCTRDAFVFLETMNREGKIAKKAAAAYGANFNLVTRSPVHYLEILAPCSDLVGSSSEYRHLHTYGFHKTCKLYQYSAVFGGLYSDALLKGSRIRKSRQYLFLPARKDRRYTAGSPLKSKLFSGDVLEQLTQRRQSHLSYIKDLRGNSAEEWFELWPSSMNHSIPNLHGNRRLFRCYEPFVSKRVVKISAGVPQEWKLNRYLFNKATKPFLKATKWLFHSDGRLPYFPAYINNFISFPTKLYRKISHKTGLAQDYQGPWYDWKVMLTSEEWMNIISRYANEIKAIDGMLEEKDVTEIFKNGNLEKGQNLNFIQQLYINQVNASQIESSDPVSLVNT